MARADRRRDCGGRVRPRASHRGDLEVDVALASMATFLFGVLIAFTTARTTERLLPLCTLLPRPGKPLVAPCEESISELPLSIGNVVEKIVVPPGDPRFHWLGAWRWCTSSSSSVRAGLVDLQLLKVRAEVTIRSRCRDLARIDVAVASASVWEPLSQWPSSARPRCQGRSVPPLRGGT